MEMGGRLRAAAPSVVARPVAGAVGAAAGHPPTRHLRGGPESGLSHVGQVGSPSGAEPVRGPQTGKGGGGAGADYADASETGTHRCHWWGGCLATALPAVQQWP